MKASDAQAARQQDSWAEGARTRGLCPTRPGRRPPRRIFLGVALLSACGLYGLSLVLFWFIQPRLESVDPRLAHGLGLVLLVGTTVLFALLTTLAAGLRWQWSGRPTRWLAARVVPMASVVWPLAHLLGVDRREFLASAERVRIELTREPRNTAPPVRVLCLVSQSLPVRLRRGVRSVCAEWGADYGELSPWTDPGEWISRVRPSGLLAVGWDPGAKPPLNNPTEFPIPTRTLSLAPVRENGSPAGKVESLNTHLAVAQTLLAELIGQSTPRANR
jgi:hypothetical protein